MNKLQKYLISFLVVLFASFIKAETNEDFRAFFVSLDAYDEYFMGSNKKIDDSDYWIYEKNLPVAFFRSGKELGKNLPHLIILNKNDKRKIVIFLEKYMQTIHYDNFHFMDGKLEFDVVDANTNKLIQKTYFVINHYDDLKLSFIKGLGIEMNY